MRHETILPLNKRSLKSILTRRFLRKIIKKNKLNKKEYNINIVAKRCLQKLTNLTKNYIILQHCYKDVKIILNFENNIDLM